jgi:hypothetical protein
MSREADRLASKRLVSAAVLKLEGVSGVGLPDGGVTVYLESDSPDIHARVTRAIEALELKDPVLTKVIGAIKRQ